VLIVDDNEDAAQILGELLASEGHSVSEAYDGLDALKEAERFQPQVVLLDIGLPTLDGYEVCRRMRAEDWGNQALLLALTGWGQADDRRKSKDAGFDHHLVKPVDLEELRALIQKYCDAGRTRTFLPASG
jgi:DNA-binding response OmpR family regulator